MKQATTVLIAAGALLVGGIATAAFMNNRDRQPEPVVAPAPVATDPALAADDAAPVAEDAKNAPGVKPVWEHVETWLRSQGGRVKPRTINTPKLVAMKGNPGLMPS